MLRPKKRTVLLAGLVLFLVGVGYVAWTLAGMPPVKYYLRHGLDPYCEPTGQKEIIEGVEFVEIGPGIFRMGSKFELGAFGASTPEGTRRTELMADAFGAYYLAHAKGATFQAKRIVDTFEIVREIGDCAFDSPGHHGTPNQREAAAMWGAELAASAQKQGHINSATLMLTLFEAELPDLIAPDAD